MATTSATWAPTGPKDEFDDYRDPVEVLRSYVPAGDVADIEAAAQAELEEAAQKALDGEIPGRDVIFKNLYAE